MKQFFLLIFLMAMPNVSCASQVATEAKKIKNPEPYYPFELVENNISGSVDIVFDIDKSGNPINCKAASFTNRGFIKSALDYCARQKYSPKLVKGIPEVDHARTEKVRYSTAE